MDIPKFPAITPKKISMIDTDKPKRTEIKLEIKTNNPNTNK